MSIWFGLFVWFKISKSKSFNSLQEVKLNLSSAELPINQFLNAGVDPKEILFLHEFILIQNLLVQLYSSFAEGSTPLVLNLEVVKI